MTSKLIFLPLCFILCVMVSKSGSAKILAVFPWPSISHQVVFRPLTQELARRGHDVTVITTDPAFPKGQTPQNLTEINVHDISYEDWRKALAKSLKGKSDFVSQLEFLTMVLYKIMEQQFRSAEVQQLMNKTKTFDLIIVEACLRSPLIFSHIYKAPVIQISSMGSVLYNSNVMGIPSHPLLYPNIISQKLYNHTVREKLDELKLYVLGNWIEKYDELEDTMLKKVFGSGIPRIRELYDNVDMLFLNVHPMWQQNVPMPPNVIHIWGIYKNVEKELPKDIKAYLDSSVHGVIFMSFGSNAVPSRLPSEKIQAFVKVFSELPYDIIWKWDKDELPGRTDNIRIGKWFPQSDLLKHPKVKLFITQGGLQSTQEAIESGVPLVGVPMFADQWYNVEKYQYFKIGNKLDIETLTEDDVRNAIHTVLEDDSFRQNIVKLRTIMRDEPESALDRAVWWTEYVLRHKGAKHLRAAGANLSWSEYYEIPLISTVIVILISISFVLLFSVLYVVKKIFTPKSKIKIQ